MSGTQEEEQEGTITHIHEATRLKDMEKDI